MKNELTSTHNASLSAQLSSLHELYARHILASVHGHVAVIETRPRWFLARASQELKACLASCHRKRTHHSCVHTAHENTRPYVGNVNVSITCLSTSARSSSSLEPRALRCCVGGATRTTRRVRALHAPDDTPFAHLVTRACDLVHHS
jgi:hypothetical protein